MFKSSFFAAWHWTARFWRGGGAFPPTHRLFGCPSDTAVLGGGASDNPAINGAMSDTAVLGGTASETGDGDC